MEKALINLQELSNSYAVERFKFLTIELSKIIASQGIQINQDSSASEQRLLNSNIHKLDIFNSHLEKNILAIQSSLLSRKPSNKEMVQNILSYMSYTAPDDFMDKISEEDIIEIYNLENIQIFRNLKFYETTTYSLSDLLMFDWPELYYRSSKMTEKLLSIVGDVLKNPSNESVTEMFHVPLHYLKEIRANPVQLCEVRFKYISPVLDLRGNKAGFIVSCTAKSMRGTIEPSELDFI